MAEPRKVGGKRRNLRIIREGHIMFSTRRLSQQLVQDGVWRVAFSEVLRGLGLKYDYEKISGRDIKDRKIVKISMERLGWTTMKEKTKLFFELSLQHFGCGEESAWQRKT